MNKPVAWMFQGAFDISTYVSFEKPNPDIYPNPTPLYTHQYERPHNTVLVPCDKLAEMQAEIKRLTQENHDLWEQLNERK